MVEAFARAPFSPCYLEFSFEWGERLRVVSNADDAFVWQADFMAIKAARRFQQQLVALIKPQYKLGRETPAALVAFDLSPPCGNPGGIISGVGSSFDNLQRERVSA